jgi:hypothetical protein
MVILDEPDMVDHFTFLQQKSARDLIPHQEGRD